MNQHEQNQNTSEPKSLPPKITKQDLESVTTTKKGKALLYAKVIIYIALSSLLIAISAYSLITPNNFTIGGAAGLAILVNVASQGRIPQSIATIAFNLPLIILSFFYVKKKFAILSTANILIQSFWFSLLETFLYV